MKNLFFLLGAASALSAYVLEKTPPPEELQQKPGDFDYDLFNRNQRAIFVSGDFLYWTVQEGGLEYAIKMKNPAWGPTPAFAQGDYQRLEYDLDPGFRVQAGFYNAPKFWEVWGQYTFIHIKGDDSVSRPSDPNLFLDGTWPQFFTRPMERARTNIALHYNLFDWFFSRVFHTNPHLKLTLFSGPSVTWMDQEWKIRYFDDTDQETFVKNKWTYWGVGPKVGVGFDWYWFVDIYLTARTSMGILTGKYKNHAFQQTTTNVSGNDNPKIPVRDARYEDYRASLAINFAIGPSYQKCFKSWRGEVFIGYESSNWFNLQEVFRSSANIPQGDKQTFINSSLLTLHGLTVRGSIDF